MITKTKPKKRSPRKNAKHFASALPQPAAEAEAEVEPLSNPVRLIDRREVMRRVPFSYPTLWKWMRDGKFPRALNGGGKICWRESEIDDWINRRPLQTIEGREPPVTS